MNLLRHPRNVASVGALLLSSAFIGVYMLIRDLFGSMSSSGASHAGYHVSGAIVAFGIVLPLLGLMLVGWAILKQQYRAVWLFWFMCLYGLAFIRSGTIGAMVGGSALALAFCYGVSLIRQRRQSSISEDRGITP